MKIQIINGPQIDLLGVREPGIYGSNSFESYLPKLKAKYPDVEIEYYQSNIEGELSTSCRNRLHRPWRSAECGCLHPHQHRPAGLHPQHEMPLRRGTYLQRASARSSAINSYISCAVWESFVDRLFLLPCHRRNPITKRKTGSKMTETELIDKYICQHIEPEGDYLIASTVPPISIPFTERTASGHIQADYSRCWFR